MFWILKSVNLALKPSFWMIRAYLRDAKRESWRKASISLNYKTRHRKHPPSSDLAPVTTILPEAKINAVVLGSRIRMITAAKRFGLYSAFLA